jgi:hypothetical protein
MRSTRTTRAAEVLDLEAGPPGDRALDRATAVFGIAYRMVGSALERLQPPGARGVLLARMHGRTRYVHP